MCPDCFLFAVCVHYFVTAWTTDDAAQLRIAPVSQPNFGRWGVRNVIGTRNTSEKRGYFDLAEDARTQSGAGNEINSENGTVELLRPDDFLSKGRPIERIEKCAKELRTLYGDFF